jgi:heat shock protein HtpX
MFALMPEPNGPTLLAVTDRRLLGLREGVLLLYSNRRATPPAGTGLGRIVFPDSGVEVRLLHAIELMTLKLLPLPAEPAPGKPMTQAAGATQPRPSADHAEETPRRPPRTRHKDPRRMHIGLATWIYTAAGVVLYVWVSAYLGFWPLWILAGTSIVLFLVWVLGRDTAVAATHAVPAGPGQYPILFQHVVELSDQAGIDPPSVYISNLPMHNAFEARVPGKSVIAVTEPLLNSLNDQELRAVLAHEVGHLRNRDTVLTQVFAAISLATTVLVALLGFAVAFVVALGARRQRDVDAVAMLIGFLVLVGAFLAAAFMALGSRHRELMADEAAIELADGHALISALNKIEAAAGLHGPEPSLALAVAAPRLFVSPFAGSILGAVLASHPSTRRRIRRLQRLLATP